MSGLERTQNFNNYLGNNIKRQIHRIKYKHDEDIGIYKKYKDWGFHGWIDHIIKNKSSLLLKKQCDYITINGKKKLDMILRYENIDEDYKKIIDKLNLTIPLSKYNTSNHKNYKSYYNDEIREKIYPYIKKDLIMFGYD